MNIKERNAALIEAVSLTDEEWNEAILEGKRKKFFHLKHKLHWDSIAYVEKSRKIEQLASVPAAPGNDAKPNP
jgi:hypothetical protein